MSAQDQRELGNQAFQQIRADLGAPSPREKAWSEMDERDKRFILKRAGVPAFLLENEWIDLEPKEQHAIIKTVQQAARWAEGLGVLQ